MLHIVGPAGLYGALVPVGLPGVVQLISMAHSVQRVIQTKCISKPIRSYRTVRWLGVSRSSSSSAPQRRSEVSLCRTDTLQRWSAAPLRWSEVWLRPIDAPQCRSAAPPRRSVVSLCWTDAGILPISSISSPISSTYHSAELTLHNAHQKYHSTDLQLYNADQLLQNADQQHQSRSSRTVRRRRSPSNQASNTTATTTTAAPCTADSATTGSTRIFFKIILRVRKHNKNSSRLTF